MILHTEVVVFSGVATCKNKPLTMAYSFNNNNIHNNNKEVTVKKQTAP